MGWGVHDYPAPSLKWELEHFTDEEEPEYEEDEEEEEDEPLSY